MRLACERGFWRAADAGVLVEIDHTSNGGNDAAMRISVTFEHAASSLSQNAEPEDSYEEYLTTSADMKVLDDREREAES